MTLGDRVLTGVLASALVLAVATWRPPQHHAAPSTVGGVKVPAGLVCAEDDAIAWTAPRTLGCVHVEGTELDR